MSQFAGTGVAIITPFDSQGEVDSHALRKVVQHLTTGKVEYLVVLGTTGESPTLSDAEQQQVIEIIQDENQGRLPIVLGIGGNNTRAVCKKVEKWTRLFQPDGILSVSPYYNKPAQAGLYEHFHKIASHTDLPIILYNVPARTGSNISAKTTLRLAIDCPNIVAIKEASGDLEQIMNILASKPADFEVLSGDDLLAMPMISCGAAGIISVTANALPLQFSDMVRASLKGNFEEARKLHYALLPLMQLNFAEGNPVGVKAMMNIQGICERFVREPLFPASESLIADMKKELALA